MSADMSLRHRQPSQLLLTWKSMQSWSLGKRASGLCRFFIWMRMRPRVRIAGMHGKAKLRSSRNRKGRHGANITSSSSSSSFGSSGTCFLLKWLQKRQRMRTCLLGCAKGEDVGTHQTEPLGYRRGLREPDQVAQMAKTEHLAPDLAELPKTKQLGSAAHDHITCPVNGVSVACLHRQGSSKPASKCGHGSSKLKASAGPCLCDLVNGNQFLVHLSAAPVPVAGMPLTKKKAEIYPSVGLSSASLRNKRDSDVNDRIVFFK